MPSMGHCDNFLSFHLTEESNTKLPVERHRARLNYMQSVSTAYNLLLLRSEDMPQYSYWNQKILFHDGSPNRLHYENSIMKILSKNFVQSRQQLLSLILVHVLQMSAESGDWKDILILVITWTCSKSVEQTTGHFLFPAIKWMQNARDALMTIKVQRGLELCKTVLHHAPGRNSRETGIVL